MSSIGSTENYGAISYAHPYSTGMAIPSHNMQGSDHIMESYAAVDTSALESTLMTAPMTTSTSIPMFAPESAPAPAPAPALMPMLTSAIPVYDTTALSNGTHDVTLVRNATVAKQELDTANANLATTTSLANELTKVAETVSALSTMLLQDANAKTAAKDIAIKNVENAIKTVTDANQAYSTAAAAATVAGQTASTAANTAATAVRNLQNAQKDATDAGATNSSANQRTLISAAALERAKNATNELNNMLAVASSKATSDTKAANDAANMAALISWGGWGFASSTASSQANALRSIANSSNARVQQLANDLTNAKMQLVAAQTEFSKNSSLSTAASATLDSANKALRIAKNAMSDAAAEDEAASKANKEATVAVANVRATLAAASDDKAAKEALAAGARLVAATAMTRYNDQMVITKQSAASATKANNSLTKAHQNVTDKSTSYADSVTSALDSTPITLAPKVMQEPIPELNFSKANFENQPTQKNQYDQIKLMYWTLLIVILLIALTLCLHYLLA